MVDLLALVIGFFLLCFLVLVALVGLTLLYRIFNLKIPEPDYNNQEQQKVNFKEDSEGDGLFFDDPLFPEETADE